MIWLFLLGVGHFCFSASPSESWMMRSNEHINVRSLDRRRPLLGSQALPLRAVKEETLEITSAQGENIPGYTADIVDVSSSPAISTLASFRDPPPIVYTIAGSDSGGGAGIQADLHTMQSFGCHGCSAVTCLTAQSSTGVTGVHSPPVSFLRQQLETLYDDLPPVAIKIGMLGSRDLAEEVGRFLSTLPGREPESDGPRVWVVLDPVMISTSGHRLIDDDVTQSMMKKVFPYVDIITPNKFEAETLLDGFHLGSVKDVEEAARRILDLGVPAVLIKGGHSFDGAEDGGRYALDYFLSRDSPSFDRPPTDRIRLCDGTRGVWLRSARYNSEHTHGTGCTLSSAIASALALGEQARQRKRRSDSGVRSSSAVVDGGATLATGLVDACCLAKAYVTAGIANGCGLGRGPGPVAHTSFPHLAEFFPSIVSNPTDNDVSPAFPTLRRFVSDASRDQCMGQVYPIAQSLDWITRLCETEGITDIQFRVKDVRDPDRIRLLIQRANEVCRRSDVRLWINDHWEPALACGCYGVHLGQEDLLECVESGGISKLREAGIALGVSVHSISELSVALGIHPTYISLGK
jgi:hydroxymethylpyrimidine kinase/phosphomethylpyrimidine kinase